MRRISVLLLGAAISPFAISSANASVLYSTAGSAYTQNFDTLPTTPSSASLGNSPAGWIDDTTTPGANQFSILGWYLLHTKSATEGGANGFQRFRAGTGASGTGAFYSFGTGTSDTERALGSVPASTLANDGDSMRMGLRLTNNTGTDLNTVTITYDGEEWRDEAGTNSLSVSYGINLPAATWNNVGTGPTPGNVTFDNALTFNPPVNANPSGGAAVNGNVAGKVAGITKTITLPAGNLWTAGSDLWIRWSELQNASINDDGLGIDNVSITGTFVAPEPTGLAVLGLGAFGLLGRRRK